MGLMPLLDPAYSFIQAFFNSGISLFLLSLAKLPFFSPLSLPRTNMRIISFYLNFRSFFVVKRLSECIKLLSELGCFISKPICGLSMPSKIRGQSLP